MYVLLSPRSDTHGHVLTLTTQNVCVWTHGPHFIVLDGFSALLFLLPAPEILAEIKRILL